MQLSLFWFSISRAYYRPHIVHLSTWIVTIASSTFALPYYSSHARLVMIHLPSQISKYCVVPHLGWRISITAFIFTLHRFVTTRRTIHDAKKYRAHAAICRDRVKQLQVKSLRYSIIGRDFSRDWLHHLHYQLCPRIYCISSCSDRILFRVSQKSPISPE